MKSLAILFFLFYFVCAHAVAPYGIQGQQQSQTLYSNVHKFPNYQVTNLGGINALVETGNKNILSNPSFEHQTFSTDWTNSAGTFTQETSIVVDGKASAKLVLSAQTMSLTQSSTLYQAQFAAGLIGIASVSVKSNVALKVCSIQAGVVSTTNCQNVASSNTWGVYTVKFNLGATSNGISIASAGAVTGTVYVDAAYVGISPPSTEACSSTLSCTDTFSAKVSAAGVVSDENVDWINGNCSVVSTSIFTCTYVTSLVTVPLNCTLNTQGSSAFGTRINSTSASNIVYTTLNTNDGTANAQAVNIICQKQGVDYIGKTINAVASDQNVRSIGSTGVDIQSVYFGSGATCDSACTTGNCTICNQVGSKITSVSWSATGIYRVNGIDGTKYNCVANGNSTLSGLSSSYHLRSSSTSSYAQLGFYFGATASNTYQASVTCIGIP